MPLIPVTLLTGFLGAGKTSLLNALLRDPAFAETAVLINEFGDIQIDHDLVAEFSPELVLTTTGCLCCTASSDIKQSLFELWTRRKNREIAPFRRVVVETTGLVDPVPVVKTLLEPPLNTPIDRIVSTQFALARVVTLLDSLNGASTLQREPEAAKQIALADAVLLSKSDLLPAEVRASTAAALGQRIAQSNPGAVVLDRNADWGAVRDLFLAPGTYDLRTQDEDALAWLHAEAVLAQTAAGAHAGHDHACHGHAADHPHHAGPPHDAAPPPRNPAAHHHRAGSAPASASASGHDPHGGTHHDDAVRSHVLILDKPVNPLVFGFFLDLLRGMAGADLLRVKGLVALSNHPDQPVVVHGVQHLIHPIDTLPRWPSDDHRTRIVVIGRHVDIEAMRRVLTSGRARAPTSA